MKSRHRPSTLALLVLFAAGCSINSTLNKIEDESERTIDIACSCSNVFPDRAMCEQQFRSFFELIDRDCLEDALAEDKDGSKETLKCTLDNAKEYNDCLEDMLDCNDSMSFQGCQSILERECPELPANVQTALQGCGAGS